MSGAPAVAAATIRRLAEAAARVDGVSPLSGHVLEALDAGGLRSIVHSAADGSPAGIAVLPDSDPAELFVAPEFRSRGLGRALVSAVLDESGAIWAHGDLPAAAALAGRLGLVRTRVLLQMRRDSETAGPLPDVELAPGVSVRTFRPGADDDAFLGVNARAFAWHPEQGRLDRAGLAAEMTQDWFDPAGFFLAVDADDRVLGFHWTKVHPSDPRGGGPIGEVYVLGVDPLSPIRGLGTPMTVIGLEYLAQQGLSTVLLYVEGDNERALALYRRLGFEVAGTDVVYRRG